MIKQMLLIRHAHASPSSDGESDFQRKLSAAGISEIHEIGKRLKQKGYMPDMVISSSATRAIDTAKSICDTLEFPNETILASEDIYHASFKELLKIAAQAQPSIYSLLLVGHNPTISQLAEHLTGEDGLSMPTCCAVMIEAEIDKWNELTAGLGKLKWLEVVDFVKP